MFHTCYDAANANGLTAAFRWRFAEAGGGELRQHVLDGAQRVWQGRGAQRTAV